MFGGDVEVFGCDVKVFGGDTKEFGSNANVFGTVCCNLVYIFVTQVSLCKLVLW